MLKGLHIRIDDVYFLKALYVQYGFAKSDLKAEPDGVCGYLREIEKLFLDKGVLYRKALIMHL